MKKITLILFLLIISFGNVFSQSDSSQIYALIARLQKTDVELSKRLTTFAEQGIEKKLEIDSISPDTIFRTAEQYIGTPHCMGGTTKECIDCSGLLFAVFNELDVKIPHGSQAIARYGTIITNKDDLLPGDLVFFINTYTTSKLITHSGFYVGEGVFIHTSSRHGVQKINFFKSNYWSPKFIFGTRILKKL